MSRVLIVKTSSLGDIVHTFPALTDAMRARPDIQFDWLVEESFADLPALHPAVKDVIPVALRRWRRDMFAKQTRAQWREFLERVQAHSYDQVIDAQGLLKSAFLVRKTQGERVGLDKDSLREPLARFIYDRTVPVAKNQHAVERVRQLFAAALKYAKPSTGADYGLNQWRQSVGEDVWLLHGTSWANKHWPEIYWKELAEELSLQGRRCVLPWGSDEEKARAARIRGHNELVEILPRMSLRELAQRLASAGAVVAVDSGLGHLAAALGVRVLALYGPTHSGLTGLCGDQAVSRQAELNCSPCLSKRCRFGDRVGDEAWPPCMASMTPRQVLAFLESGRE